MVDLGGSCHAGNGGLGAKPVGNVIPPTRREGRDFLDGWGFPAWLPACGSKDSPSRGGRLSRKLYSQQGMGDI